MKLKLSPEQFSRAELARLKRTSEDRLSEEDLEKNLFKYRAYKKRLEKDLLKAKKSMNEEEDAPVAFYLTTEYAYLDKDDMPLLVVGNPSSNWRNFLKQRIKDHKATDATGVLRFVQEEEILYLELTIEHGKAKHKIIKKLFEKWLLPNNMEVSFAAVEAVTVAPDLGGIHDADYRLDTTDPIQALFVKWKRGDYAGEEAKKIARQIKGNLDQWMEQYESIGERVRMGLNAKKEQYDFILGELDDPSKITDGADIGEAGIVLDGGDGVETLSTIDLSSLSKPGKLSASAYIKVYKVLEGFNEEDNLKRKRQLFAAVMNMIKRLALQQANDVIAVRQLNDLIRLYNAHLPFLEEATTTKLDLVTTTSEKPKLLFKAIAGTQKSTEEAINVRDATIDDRALRLVELLQRGNAFNDDSTFGAVVKWLADNEEEELADKYKAITRRKFKRSSNLHGDILQVFEPNSLRTRYLFDKLENYESPYARLAFALGLMGKTWLSTAEREDSMTIVESMLNANEIEALLTATDKTTFEGAIADHLKRKRKSMKAQMEQQVALLRARENNVGLEEANDAYLSAMISRLRGGKVLKQIDKKAFYANFQRWYDGATDKERKAMLDEESQFMKNLMGMASTFSVSGFSKGDLAFIKAKLEAPQTPPPGRESNVIFDQLKAIADKQATKYSVTRWMEDTKITQQFKDLLFDESVKDPQRAIIAKFGRERDLEAWDRMIKEIADGETTYESNEQRLEEILGYAVDEMTGMMEQAGVGMKHQRELVEVVRSSGAKGKNYYKLLTLSKVMPAKTIGGEVEKIISSLKADSPEYAVIQKDEALLRTLQIRILGSGKSNKGVARWKKIAQQLNLTGQLAMLEIPKQEQGIRKSQRNLRRMRTNQRSKLHTQQSLASLQKENKELEKDPNYWAGKVIINYKKRPASILQVLLQAQQAGVALRQVLEALTTHAKGSAVLDYIQKGKQYSSKTIREADAANRPIKSAEVLLAFRKRAMISSKRKVKMDEVTELVDSISPEEWLKDAFDVERLKRDLEEKKRLQTLLNNTELSTDNRRRYQQQLEDVEDRIRRFDLSSDFLKTIDRVLSPANALVIKERIRNKVGNALLETGDNPTKAELEGAEGLTKEDVRLMGQGIKNISAIEKAKQTETGLQWRNLSSRRLQLDDRTGVFLQKGWKAKERIKALEGVVPPLELEAEKNKLLEGLMSSEEELQEAMIRFEERKKQYDDTMKKYINALAQAVFFTLTMSSGVGAAAGVVQLVWALSSTLMKTTIAEVVKRVTEGDRSNDTFLRKTEDFFWTALADQAGAVTGLIGAELAFAIDVKSIGTLSQGTANDGGAALKAWEDILRTPFLKTASGAMKNLFSDIGKNFVKELSTKRTGELLNPIGDFKAWGERTIKDLPKSYLKSLLLTSAAAGITELAEALNWDDTFLKYHNTSAATNFDFTEEGGKRPFAPDDARVGLFDTDAKNFSDWFNGWGMFNSKPTFGGIDWEAGDNPEEGLTKVFTEAAKNLKDPKVLMALGNAAVWGSMDGSKLGVKQQLEGLVDKSLDNLFGYVNVELDDKQREQLRKIMTEGLEESIKEYQKDILEVQKTGGAQNIQFLAFEVEHGTLEPHVILEIWETMDWNLKNGQQRKRFFAILTELLGLHETEFDFLSREPDCKELESIRAYRNYYEKNRGKYVRIFANKPFVEAYSSVKKKDGIHARQLKGTLTMDGKTYAVIRQPEDDLHSVYAEWKDLQDLNVQGLQFRA